MFEKLVIVTRKTRLDELVERHNTRAQVKFLLEHSGHETEGFSEYAAEDDAYRRSLDTLRRSLEVGLKVQCVDRALLSTFSFTDKDLVVAIGQDGLVANTAKYIGEQPLLGVNPDPARFDGALLPFTPAAARAAVARTMEGKARIRPVTLAEARLADGQRLLAFNDLYLGSRSHVSSRYRLRRGAEWEPQSSSGVLVSTGAGSTGWLSSLFNMASGVAALTGGKAGPALKLAWEDPRLVFVVREPFLSRHSKVDHTAGVLEEGSALELESLMPAGGVVFSDGVEADFLEFNSGAVARIGAAQQRAQLVVG
jgi:NAD kinase